MLMNMTETEAQQGWDLLKAVSSSEGPWQLSIASFMALSLFIMWVFIMSFISAWYSPGTL